MEADRGEKQSLIAKHSENAENSTAPVAAHADNLDGTLKSVDDAATVSGGLWLSYLFVLFYIAIAAGAVTHADLLLENPIKLPFLSVELPLKAFFFLSPLLFLIAYAYTLAHLVILADKAKLFHQQLRKQVNAQEHGPDLKKREAARISDSLRRQLPSNVLVQFLAGPDDIRESWFGTLLKTIAWTTLVIAPVLLILLLQIQFLPYHDLSITWTHRVALLADLLLVWWLWRKILSGRGTLPRSRSPPALVLGIAASLAVFMFSWTVATYPGEWQDDRLPSIKVIPKRWVWGRSSTELASEVVSLHELFFAGEVDDITRRRKSVFSNTLVLPGFDIYEGLKVDDPAKGSWKAHSIDLRGRHLERAVLDASNLLKVDLSGAHLEGASLVGARLQEASLDGARLQGAALLWTGFQSASLAKVQLQGTVLLFTQFQGALLREAKLQGASLIGVQLMGASLDNAQVQGASLVAVNLSGASLFQTRLQGATVINSQIWAASLESAQLQGGSLWWSGFAAADLRKAAVWRAFGQSDMSELLVSQLTWGPQYLDEGGQLVPWTQETYLALRRIIERELSPGEHRTDALKRIERLDCEKKRIDPFSEFKTGRDPIFLTKQTPRSGEISIDLAPCDPKANALSSSIEWRPFFEKAATNENNYTNYIASVLGDLVCEGKDIVESVAREAAAMAELEKGRVSRLTAGGFTTPWAHPEIGSIHILRGLFMNGRFEAAGAEAPA
jgi:uncharacterized protein YjbI with pentapeptide repeats